MIVSGLTIDSKKIITAEKHKPNQVNPRFRPSSYELPGIKEPRALTSTKFVYNSTNQHILQQSLPKPLVKVTTAHSRGKPSPKNYTSENDLPLKKKNSKEVKEWREEGKKAKLQLNKGETELCLFEREEELMAFFRYAPVILISSSGNRERFLKELADKGDVTGVGPKPKRRKDLLTVWQKLTKLALLKGKYKYRQKFNFLYSSQLKAIDYKRKELKKKKESESSSSDEQLEKKEKCRDLQTWKKSMGVEGKVFIIRGKYPDLKHALLERGWVENEDRNSLLYDLKWTTKVSDVNFESLRGNQLVNHFNNNACLTSKYGIIKSLRSIMFAEGVDIDRFFPKAFDMSDLQDFENFIEVYKWVFCLSILKTSQGIKGKTPQDKVKLVLALIVTLRRLLPAERMLSGIAVNQYPLCSPAEWRFLSSSKEVKAPLSTMEEWGLLQLDEESLEARVKQVLEKLEGTDPQTTLDGTRNIWIVKPAFLSRGRGIKCMNDLDDILNYALGKETQYVVQKYIQNPLLINRRKFDIRQWVIVEDYNPPKIWFYGQFYCRFCLEEYDACRLGNRYMHLTNNSVQKQNSKANKETISKESMWTMEELKQYAEEIFGEGSLKEVVAQMKEIVVATIISTQDQVYGRKGSFELIGYDFMLDDRLQPWLIEVNSSPAMDYSTEVTRRLVKMVLEDTVKVMIDPFKKKVKKKGLFRLIYDGESPYQFKRYKMATNKEQ